MQLEPLPLSHFRSNYHSSSLNYVHSASDLMHSHANSCISHESWFTLDLSMLCHFHHHYHHYLIVSNLKRLSSKLFSLSFSIVIVQFDIQNFFCFPHSRCWKLSYFNIFLCCYFFLASQWIEFSWAWRVEKILHDDNIDENEFCNFLSLFTFCIVEHEMFCGKTFSSVNQLENWESKGL